MNDALPLSNVCCESMVPLDQYTVNSTLCLLSNRNTEAGAGRTGGRSHRSYSAALSRPVRTQPQPTIHVEVSHRILEIKIKCRAKML